MLHDYYVMIKCAIMLWCLGFLTKLDATYKRISASVYPKKYLRVSVWFSVIKTSHSNLLISSSDFFGDQKKIFSHLFISC